MIQDPKLGNLADASSGTTDLAPIAVVRDSAEFALAFHNDGMQKMRQIEKNILESCTSETFNVEGFCAPCNKNVPFLVDMNSGTRNGTTWRPNWRERLVCPTCKMNNRQRLIATLIKQEVRGKVGKNIYFMEHVTPIYAWANSQLRDQNLIGSEYLGHEYEGGTIVKGIRHEDIENLSFSDSVLDLIVSNDVFEHVPNPAKAFAECARVLRAGGTMLATIPFHAGKEHSESRAKLVNGDVTYLLPAAYHGNPVSADGSLVFTDFGWDMIKEMENAGFSSAVMEIYGSRLFGHLGDGELVFRARK